MAPCSIYLPFKKVLTGQPLAQPSDDINTPTFISSFFTGETENSTMALVTNSGQVFIFNQVELDLFHKALNAGDLESLKDAQARIETSITTTTIGPVSGCVSVPGRYLLATERGITRMVLGGED